MNGFIAQKKLGSQPEETLPATAAATEAEALTKLAAATGLGPQTIWAKIGYSIVPASLPDPPPAPVPSGNTGATTAKDAR